MGYGMVDLMVLDTLELSRVVGVERSRLWITWLMSMVLAL